ncbi:Rne/Rng family ribonuclease [Agromyces aerolatus]|uniref:Rne/Rng family ribonuclease n=1 Tax=Agromyces sp. LY-1074 TaxID=3074080 RepID=UPI0028637B43|nr:MULTISPECIES: Rne/Rng family ribonuclease [unclassified Agromyces]MDR5700698.1 Rne/Rng family ribonuclease [Agromyces sp. LY-1074]MDR5707219.1 Rne/Rng family ribonuclease [Agromyces sp. LY-1358]
MVEGNDQQTNDSGNDGTPRRRGLFGSRRSRSRSAAVPPSDVPVTSPDRAADHPAPASAPGGAGDAPTAAHESPAAVPDAGGASQAAQGADEASGAETTGESRATGTGSAAEPAGAEPAPEAEASAQPETPTAPELEPITAGLTTTSLIFRAPPVLKVTDDARDAGPSGDESGSSVRRRTRRRSGEDERRQGDEPANTVVKVRKPREPELITEPQKVKGSTRLEAKKQRRRDGRDAGRRRAIITESEFLARRESVDRQMIVRQKGGRIQIGVLEDGVLVEHYVARNQDASLIGNVYLGRVQNVLPSMEAAFVDIGRGRNAVLYSGEVDWEAAAENGEKNQPRRIELALKPGDKVLVQVTKDPVGHKGARLTSQVSLPGRYLVYVPNGSMNGISRKLPDTERARLKKILKAVLPENVGVIVRTAAEGATEEQLTLDVNRLTAQWSDISTSLEKVQAPALLHSEPDLLVKIVRDVFNEDFQKMIIAGDEARQTIEKYLRAVAPDLLERVEAYEGERDAFDEFRISEQIEKALDRKVWLPSGGSLVIDRTEAMTVVDVNTGKFVGSGGNLEETVTKNNLEAAEEVVRQLRLRDIGGIIVVDFIDMVLESNRDLVLRRLVECLSRDRTKHQVAEVTSLGLVQMTRKKLGLGLLETFSEPCEVCAGRGIIVHHEPIMKHRAPQQQVERGGRRNRGGGSREPQQQPQPAPTGHHNGAHEITEDVKHALAQIAASTIAHANGEEGKADAPATGTGGSAASGSEQAEAGAPKHGRASHPDESGESAPGGRRGRHRRASKEQSAPAAEAAPVEAAPAERAPSQGASAGGRTDAGETRSSASRRTDASGQAPSAEASAPAPTLDLPGLPDLPDRRERSRPAADPDALLGSVLDALPAPKKPGEGRGRSRRVSTAALSGNGSAPVIVRPEDAADGGQG